MSEPGEERYSLRKRAKVIYVDQFPTTSEVDVAVQVVQSLNKVGRGDLDYQSESDEDRRRTRRSGVKRDKVAVRSNGGKRTPQQLRGQEMRFNKRFLSNSPVKKRVHKGQSDYDVDVDFLDSAEEDRDDNEYVEVIVDNREVYENSFDAPYNNSYVVECVRKELRGIFEYEVQGAEYEDPKDLKKMYVSFYVLKDFKSAILRRYQDNGCPGKALIGLDKGDDKDGSVLLTLAFVNEGEKISEGKFLVLAGWRHKDDYEVLFHILNPIWRIIQKFGLNLTIFWKFAYISKNYGLRSGFQCVFCKYHELQSNKNEKGAKKLLENSNVILNLPLDKVYVRIFEQKIEVVNKLIRLMEKFLLEDENTEKFYKILNKKKLYMARSKLKYKFRKHHSLQAAEVLDLAERLESEVRSDIPEVGSIAQMLVLFKSLMNPSKFSVGATENIHKNLHTSSNPCKSCEKMVDYIDEFGRNEMDGYIHMLCHHANELRRIDSTLSVNYEIVMEKIQKDFCAAKTKQCCRDETKKDSMAARYLAVQTFLPDQTKHFEEIHGQIQENGGRSIPSKDQGRHVEIVEDEDVEVDDV
ncbi:unnamed protein product [Bursaphelenchus xylophilus]|uniref:(pine wood nematode) hypothetical protein n=1 Tax=Bursaphelenchus xylophilus TaxID=6326 RepID=A0A1I7S023_BURXY|nr:unnamed protein product [Bursaphelenchus xylophilus]CAG9109070.1 unnamed protein product [Bursaphelenchus xylophilus]